MVVSTIPLRYVVFQKRSCLLQQRIPYQRVIYAKNLTELQMPMLCFVAGFPAFMVSGGQNGRSSMVEVLSPTGNVSCRVPQLPDKRYFHTMDNNTICGGGGGSVTWTSCMKITPSGWVQTHSLTQISFGHCSWVVEDGIILIGGSGSNARDNSEIAKWDGTTRESFGLEYGSL